MYNTEEPFIPEISGDASSFTRFGNDRIEIVTSITPILLFRLPLRTNEFGTVGKIANYLVNYNYDSENNDGYIRRGTLDITADFSNLNTPIQLIDTFDYAGIPDNQATSLKFIVQFIDTTGSIFNGTGTLAGLGVFYKNSLDPDQGLLTYTYRTIY